MLDFAGFSPGALLMDVCCGEGATVEYLLESGFNARGIDRILPLPGTVTLCGSAYELPCSGGELDGILCECALSILEYPDDALREWSRVLRPDGRLLLSDLYSQGEGGGVEKFRNLFSRQGIERLLLCHGFAIQYFGDCSSALAAFVGQTLLEGKRETLFSPTNENHIEMKRLKCSYYVLVADKL